MRHTVPVPVSPRQFRWSVVAVVAFLIFVFSVAPVPNGGLSVTASDSLYHMASYFVLGSTLVYATLDSQDRYISLVIVASVASYGLGIELVQSVLPHRSFELADIAANAVGASLSLPLNLLR